MNSVIVFLVLCLQQQQVAQERRQQILIWQNSVIVSMNFVTALLVLCLQLQQKTIEILDYVDYSAVIIIIIMHLQ